VEDVELVPFLLNPPKQLYFLELLASIELTDLRILLCMYVMRIEQGNVGSFVFQNEASFDCRV